MLPPKGVERRAVRVLELGDAVEAPAIVLHARAKGNDAALLEATVHIAIITLGGDLQREMKGKQEQDATRTLRLRETQNCEEEKKKGGH